MSGEIRNFIELFREQKVLIVGDAILDGYFRGEATKFVKEAPAPVICVSDKNYFCGGAANVALNIAALGGGAYFLSVVGDDVEGEVLGNLLERGGVHTRYLLKSVQRKTIAKRRVVAGKQILLRYDEGSPDEIKGELEEKFISNLVYLYHAVDAVIVSDYRCGVLTKKVIETLGELHKETPGKVLAVDSYKLDLFKGVCPTVVKPNYQELTSLLGLAKSEKRINQIIEQNKRLFEMTGSAIVAATCDEDGSVILERSKKPYHVESRRQNNVNASGAGDTFASAFTLALSAGASAQIAGEIGAAAAQVVLQKNDTAVCSDIELTLQFSDVPKSFADRSYLSNVVEKYKSEGKRIVFTNGCFDILHRGHVDYLQKAKALGDVLIVGVNTDASVKRYKGEERPVNSLEDRLFVLAGLGCVDVLVPFDEDVPLPLIEIVKPDVYVKGGDYTIDKLPEAKLTMQYGGQAKIIPFVSDRSTTAIINKIRAEVNYGTVSESTS
jgi:D-beta-D-heptose 7-phosphate kinase / D-beta-D-heptose 1-phosphate adenosyltransferase